MAGVLNENRAAILADCKIGFLLLGFICIPRLDAATAAERFDRVWRNSEFLANTGVRIVEFSELKNTVYGILFDIITSFSIVIIWRHTYVGATSRLLLDRSYKCVLLLRR